MGIPCVGEHAKRRRKSHVIRTYRIKNESAESRVIDAKTGKASFVGKAQLTDETLTGRAGKAASNLNFEMKLTDDARVRGRDTISFTLKDQSNRLVFSSCVEGSLSIEQLIAGGNVVVH